MNRIQKRTVLGLALSTALVLAAGQASAQTYKLGFLGGITGPIQGAVPAIIDNIRLAVKQVNDQGGMGEGQKLDYVQADTKCDNQNAVSAANKLVNIDNVTAIVGALCSGATISAANSVTVSKGVLMISPSATSPAISGIKDDDMVFRVAPSDGFQGKILAKALLEQGVKKVALTYANTDYAKPLASAFREAYTDGGGTIAGDQIHEDKKSSYRSELATLRRGGAPVLVVIGYPQSSVPVILRQSLEGGMFKRFAGPEAIYDDKLWQQIGMKNLEGLVHTQPADVGGASADVYAKAIKAYKPDAYNKLFTAQAYDAAFILALAMEKTGGKREGMSAAVRAVANGPGVKVLPGEWAKAKKLIAAGTAINYEGASGSVDFDKAGDINPVYDFFVVQGGKKVKIKTY